jgi:glutamate racemase
LSGAPIGVFDSGVGGLTVLRALRNELPREQFVYLGDTARLPYGIKSAQTVARYAVQAAEALVDYGIKCLVVACNTASAVGLPGIRERFDFLQVSGVIEPGAAAACAASRSGRIAVIGTEGTIRGGAYQDAMQRLRIDVRLAAIPTQLFVALAEEGITEGPIAAGIAQHYLSPLFGEDAAKEERPDTLVLGCTHFPMLAGVIRETVGIDVTLVDSALTTAQHVHASLKGAGLLESAGQGDVKFLATDGPERFARVGSRFLGRPLSAEDVELVNL